MGWSCTRDASLMLTLIQLKCNQQTGFSNTFCSQGKKYFFEKGVESSDGSITGSIWKMLENDKARKSNSFKIEHDGRIVRGPKFFKDIELLKVDIDGYTNVWLTDTMGEPTESNLFKYVKHFVDSFKPGGVNEKIKCRYPKKASIVDVNNKVIVSWQVGMFQVWD